MKNKFKKGQIYRFKGVEKDDGFVPSKGALIKIESGALAKRVKYSIIEGTPPTNSNCHFWNDSEMAENLELVKEKE